MPVDDGINMGSRLAGAPPWRRAGYGSSKGVGKRPSLHYRGWTLIDSGHSRYAVKDGTSIRKRVCRANEEQGVAIKAFRKIVDETEAR